MYVRRRIRLASIVADSWRELLFVLAWSSFVVMLHEAYGLKALAMPVLPVSALGLAVSMYLGFKSPMAYERWWEARRGIGDLSALSLVWAMQTNGLVGCVQHAASAALHKELIYRHLAAIHAFASQMRATSRLPSRGGAGIFVRRRPVDARETLFSTPEVYENFLSPAEYAEARAALNPSAFLMSRQAAALHDLVQRGIIGAMEQQVMLRTLGEILVAQDNCQRIKNTPFPRQIAFFGLIFTWIYVLLIPLALLDALVHEAVYHALPLITTHEFVATLMSLSLVMSWVFLTMEKITDSTEDPFEGGVHDVPLASVCRGIEIELRASLGETHLPRPLQPVDDVLY